MAYSSIDLRSSFSLTSLLTLALVAIGCSVNITDFDATSATESTTSTTSTATSMAGETDPSAASTEPTKGSNSGETSTESGTEGATEGATESGTESGTESASDSESGGDFVCEDYFLDEAPSEFNPVQISLRNNTEAGIWLRGYQPTNDSLGFREQVFEIAVPGGDEPFLTTPNPCDFTCASILAGALEPGDCGTLCTNGGGNPGAIYIAPGGVYSDEWDGSQVILNKPQAECWECTDTECYHPVNAPLGEYEVRTFMGTQIDCDGDCSCTPNEEGWCRLEEDGFGAQAIGDQVTLTTALTLPGAPVEFNVDP